MWRKWFKKKSNKGFNRTNNLLSDLIPGQFGFVKEISEQCQGLERRRLMDLGFVPGSKVEAAIRSPFNDPVAYRVKGALIALRKQQAALIRINPS